VSLQKKPPNGGYKWYFTRLQTAEQAFQKHTHLNIMAINCLTGLFRTKDMPLLRATNCITGLFRTIHSPFSGLQTA
jgi:hypothetical protein